MDERMKAIMVVAEKAAKLLAGPDCPWVDVMAVAREPRGGYTVTLYVPEINERVLLEANKGERLTEQSESI